MIPVPGEIYWAEIADQPPRPVVVISREALNRGSYVIVVPFTSAKFEERRRLPNCVPFLAGEYGLSKDCVAQAEAVAQIRKDSLDTAIGAFGVLSDESLRNVIRAVGNAMGSECEPL